MRIPQELVPHLTTAPQPVALALGRVVRAGGRPERLEACLKAAEVLTRYVAIASLASAASTRGAGDDLPTVDNFEGNLSFGSFELAIFKTLGVSWDHPLREDLRTAMRGTKKNPGKAGTHLRAFVELRNELGHSITHVDEIKAANVFEEVDPIGGLIDCLEALAPVLACPPLVVLKEEHRRGRLTALLNFHVGEGEPIPIEIHLREPVFEWELPYLCTGSGLLPLAPGLTMLARPDGRRGLYVLDGIEDAGLRYKSVLDNDVRSIIGAEEDLGRWLHDEGGDARGTDLPLLEEVRCADGRSLHGYLRNESLPSNEGSKDAFETFAAEVASTGWTVGTFEQACNNVGLGAAYRDVLYAFLEHGCRAEATAQGVEVVDGPDGLTLLVFELQAGPVLTCTIQLEAFEGPLEGTRSVALAPGQAADELVTEISDLLLGQ